jgi:hypothetical protein
MVYVVSIFWGVFSSMLGFSVLHGWQALAVILAANLTFFLGRASKCPPQDT